IPINLVPPPTEAPPARRVPLRAVALGVALVGALGLYVATTVRDGWELRRLEDAVAALQPKVEKVNLLQRESSQLRTEKEALVSMSTRNPSILQLLRELTLVIPASAWLTDTNFNGRELVIGGYAKSSLELIGLLEESPRFSNVEFRGTITKRDGKERFKISAQIE
ncbi:MAG: PilN domain-containing protein, partial [Nitrospinae bacterium]|nr:PilN domain-containing protein [Nitrospinota bacterium]